MEQISFKNCYTVSHDTFKEWEKLHVLKKKTELIFQGIWLIFALIGLVMFVQMLKEGKGYPVLPLVLLAFCAFRGLILPPMRKRAFVERVIRNAGQESWERTILFGETMIVRENKKSAELRFRYQQIQDIQEYDKWYAIIIEKSGVIYVAQNGFVKGNKDKFIGWLEEQRRLEAKSEVEEPDKI